MSIEAMKKAIVESGWKWPFTDGKMLAMRTDGRTGIFKFRRGPKVCFYIITPWVGCPDGDVSVEFCR